MSTYGPVELFKKQQLDNLRGSDTIDYIYVGAKFTSQAWPDSSRQSTLPNTLVMVPVLLHYRYQTRKRRLACQICIFMHFASIWEFSLEYREI